MSQINSYKDLIVWQKAMDLVTAVYELTSKYPKEEAYGLTSQSRRAAVSILSNIAEGRFRSTRNDFRHFLIVAYGSAAELETQIEIAKKLSFVNEKDTEKAQSLLVEVMKMINTITKKLKANT